MCKDGRCSVVHARTVFKQMRLRAGLTVLGQRVALISHPPSRCVCAVVTRLWQKRPAAAV